MAREIMTCPHCNAHGTFESCAHHDVTNERGFLFFLCSNCEKPIVVLVEASRPNWEFKNLYNVAFACKSLKACGWSVLESWPTRTFRKIALSAGTPRAAALLFQHCQKAAGDGAHELCFLGLRHLLKMVQTEITPDFRGSLLAWITLLTKTRKLTADMVAWAKDIKICTAAYEVSVMEAEQFLTFVEVLLDQLFTVHRRRTAYLNSSNG